MGRGRCRSSSCQLRQSLAGRIHAGSARDQSCRRNQCDASTCARACASGLVAAPVRAGGIRHRRTADVAAHDPARCGAVSPSGRAAAGAGRCTHSRTPRCLCRCRTRQPHRPAHRSRQSPFARAGAALACRTTARRSRAAPGATTTGADRRRHRRVQTGQRSLRPCRGRSRARRRGRTDPRAVA